MIAVTHILYLSEVPGRSPFSGAENHVFLLLGALAAAGGVDVELIAMLWDGDDYPNVSVKLDGLESAGVRVVRLRRATATGTIRRWAAMLRSWVSLWALLRSRRNRAIHLHLDLFASVLIARFAGCRRVVLSVHNDEPAYATPRWRLWWRIVDLCVHRYIAITHHVSRYMRQVGGMLPTKVFMIYYGLPQTLTVPITRQQYGIQPNSFVVGFIGRLAPQKNLSAFIEAMATLSDVTAVIVGAGPLREDLERQIQELGISNVRLLGPVPNAQALMPMFDVFCLPSRWEGLGLVLIEAMRARVPIVGSDRGAIPEMLGNGRFGLVFSPTPTGIADAIGAVRTLPDLARHRADEAYIHASNVFTISRMVSQTIAVYNGL
jgi:glycosyltransferase involved in cell wall biosynthesis